MSHSDVVTVTGASSGIGCTFACRRGTPDRQRRAGVLEDASYPQRRSIAPGQAAPFHAGRPRGEGHPEDVWTGLMAVVPLDQAARRE